VIVKVIEKIIRTKKYLKVNLTINRMNIRLAFCPQMEMKLEIVQMKRKETA
jgi:hypothetical protein